MERIAFGLMTIFLCLAAFVQLNDPDSLTWMIIYGLPGILTLAVFINSKLTESRSWWLSCATVFTCLLSYSVVHFLTYISSDKLSWTVITTEEGREAAGLCIVLVWMCLLLSYTRQNKGSLSLMCRCGFILFAVIQPCAWLIYKYYIQPNIDVPEHCSSIL